MAMSLLLSESNIRRPKADQQTQTKRTRTNEAIPVTCHRNEITYEEQPDGSYRKHIVCRRVSQKAIDEYARRRGMSDYEKARFLGHLL